MHCKHASPLNSCKQCYLMHPYHQGHSVHSLSPSIWYSEVRFLQKLQSQKDTKTYIYIVKTSLYTKSPWSSQQIPFSFSVPQSCTVLSGVYLSIEKSKTSSNSESLFWFRFWKAALSSNCLWRLLPLLTDNSLPTRTNSGTLWYLFFLEENGLCWIGSRISSLFSKPDRLFTIMVVIVVSPTRCIKLSLDWT